MILIIFLPSSIMPPFNYINVHSKRLQQGTGPRPFHHAASVQPGSAQPPSKSSRRRTTPFLTKQSVSAFQRAALEFRLLLRPVNGLVAKMVAIFVQLVMFGNTTLPSQLNHDKDLKTVQIWNAEQPSLFLISQDVARVVLEWARNLRLAISHKWLGKIEYFYHEQLSAVILLAGPDMMNAPAVVCEAQNTLRKISPFLSPIKILTTLPPKHPRKI